MAEPRPLVVGDRLSESWTEFHEEFVGWLIALERKVKCNQIGLVDVIITEEERVSAFVTFLGADGRMLFRNLFPNKENKDLREFYGSLTIKEVVSKFTDHSKKQLNPAAETHVLNQIYQGDGEPFGEFLTRVRSQVRKCAFVCTCGLPTESRAVRDRIVEGVRDKNLRLKLLSKENLDEEDAVKICRAFEATSHNV